MLYNIKKRSKCLQIQKKSVPLHQVFHGIRFKVNKGWVKALTLFLCPYVTCPLSYRDIIGNKTLCLRVSVFEKTET